MKPISTGLPALALTLWLASLPVALAQDAVPTEVLGRTLLIKAGDTYGTAFTLDYEGMLYIVTARHVVGGLPEEKAALQIKRGQKWFNVNTIKTLFPKSKDVDIAVFQTGEKIDNPYQIKSTEMGGVTMGQQLWFLGYPYGLESQFGKAAENHMVEAPFIKRGTMSAVDGSNPDAVVLYIDAFNNPGFSGGPIVYWDFSKHSYGIVGVVMGYRLDNAKVVINGRQADSDVLVNSGILIGYSIDHAIQAIKQGLTKQP
jgi:hypothetical protein